MNFFEHQEKARRQTRWLVFLFILTVVAIIMVIDVVLLIAFGLPEALEQQALSPDVNLLVDNVPLLTGGAVTTASVIGLAILFKTAMLRSGGGKVARDLGGTLVDADTADPLRRRLRNVVEEIAIASGVPVPEIYILEKEAGINAFAAGFSPADAAIAVTRGTLEKLNRSELQGVIAHEFSHVFNGDMRLNIRLMGALFGILLLALIGRRVLANAHFVGSSRNKNGGVVILLAIALMLVGYVGLFFGRWIKASVSRKREYLADASAVQFTRDPDGITGALKKIAVYSEASYLDTESEEVGHMLFGAGQPMRLMATHPPLDERIRRIEPGFRKEQLDELAAKIKHQEVRRARRAERDERAAQEDGSPSFGQPQDIIDQIGNPDFSRVLIAAAVAASIPDTVRDAARSTEWAPEVLFTILLDEDTDTRERQLLAVARGMGLDSEQQVRGLIAALPALEPEQRLPLLDMALPGLKRRPPDFVRRFLSTVEELIEADGRTDVFEYLLAKVISQHLWESMNPKAVRLSGRKTLVPSREAVLRVLAVVALHGHTKPDVAASAFSRGLERLEWDLQISMPDVNDWVVALDESLGDLDALKAPDKEQFVRAMLDVVTADEQVLPVELELLRAICASIHVPLPVFHRPVIDE
jgi:Zn-dependent protease with chaperone function